MRTSPVHYIAPSDISITPNANNSANDLAVYVARGAKIKVYSPLSGVDTVNGTYQEWTLSGRNRRLVQPKDEQGRDINTPYTIYARLKIATRYTSPEKIAEAYADGYLIFAPKLWDDEKSEWYDKYAYISPEGRVGHWTSEHYLNYFVRLGDVSIIENGKRTVTFDTGILGTELFNTEWALNPDSMPLRIYLTSMISNQDAGPTPYVYWGQTLVLSASLIEGWTGTDIQRFDHWEILRDTGSDADTAWNTAANASDFRTTGVIELMHGRGATQGVRDDFNSAVNTTFIVNAMERTDDPEEGGTPTYAVLKSASIGIMAETWEKYELSLGAQMVTYNPITQSYSPNNGVKFNIRATDQKNNVFLMTNKQVGDTRLVAQYAVIDTDSWIDITISGPDNNVAGGTVPASAFSTNKQSINVRLLNGATVPKELHRTTIAFLRDGEDSKEREWIFLRSATEITFGTQEHPYPSSIAYGEVNPPNRAAGHVSDNKNQDGWVPEGWWDDEQGVTSQYPYEYGAYRDYDHANDQWGAFTTPKIWHHYGKDADVWTIGNDGYWYKNGVKTNTKAEGKDGTGVEIKGGVDVLFNADKTSQSQTSLEGLTGMTVGDCYAVTANKHLYFYDGTTAATAANPAGWRDLGKFSGDDGLSLYMHIAYADNVTFDAQGHPTSCTGFTVTKQKEAYDWIGLCTNNSQTDPTTYTAYEWNKVKGAQGDNAVILSLSNQHEDFLYDDAGNNKTGNVTSQATLYDGAVPVSASNVTWTIVSDSSKTYGVPTSGTNAPTLVNGLLTVKALTANTAKVTIKATYPKTNGQDYYAEFTANKRNQDVYSLDIQPNIISYNTSETFVAPTLTIKAHRTSIDGSKADINSFNGGLLYFAGYYKTSASGEAEWRTVASNGSFGPINHLCTYNDKFLFELRKVKSGATYSVSKPSTYTVEDFQTVDVQKYHNGANSTVPGPNGEDAVNVVVSPASMIIEQDINNKNNIAYATDNNLGQFSIQVLKGIATACTITRIVATASQVYVYNSPSTGQQDPSAPCDWQPNSQIANLYLKGIAKDNQNNYYTTGQIVLAITYTDPDTNTSKTISSIIAKVYVNLIGSWSEKVENDMKTELAHSSLFDIDNDPKSRTYGEVIETENWGEFYRSSTENISRLTKKVDDGKNLLTLVRGWEGPGGTVVQYDEKNFGVRNRNDALYSPVIFGIEGESYCFSVYIDSNNHLGGNPGYCYDGALPTHASDLDDNGTFVGATFIEVPDDTITIGNDTYQRYYFIIPGNVVADKYFTIYNDGNYWFYCPQLEVGAVLTAFSAGTIETTSQIKQTADEIGASVRDDLGEVGINISGPTKTINLQADKVTFSDAQGGNTDKIQIDPTTGTMRMVNAIITGATMIDSVKTFDLFGDLIDTYYQNVEVYDFTTYLDEGETTLSKIWLLGNRFIFTLLASRNYSSRQRKLYIHIPPAEFFKGQTILINNGMFEYVTSGVSRIEVWLHVDTEICILNKDARDSGDIADNDSAIGKIRPSTGEMYAPEGNEEWLINGIFYNNLRDGMLGAIMKEIEITDFEWIELTAWESHYYNEDGSYRHAIEWKVIRWSKDMNE